MQVTPQGPSRLQQPSANLKPETLWTLTLWAPGHTQEQTHLQNQGGQANQFTGFLVLYQTPALPSGNGFKLMPSSMLRVYDQEAWPGGAAPKGYHWVTITASPGPGGARVTVYEPKFHMAWITDKVDGTCTLDSGNYNSSKSCTVKVPATPFGLSSGENDIEVIVTVDNTVYFGKVEEGYTATPHFGMYR